jgi:Arc/MetJ-type ribon-helix-helix transcriptional regulator
MNVSLSNDLRDFVRKKVESGDFASEEAVLQEAVRRFQQGDQPGPGSDEKAMAEDLIDYEAIKYCARELEGKDVPSIDEVRRFLAKIPGSMAQAVIEERETRS